jgi:uncharacterized protein (TIGR03086 family)
MEILEQLEGAFDSTGRIVGRIQPAQLSEPTPCKEWDVRALLEHATGVINRFRSTALREPAGDAPPSFRDDLGDDFFASYRTAANAALSAWSRAGALEGTCRSPAGTEIPAPVAANINFVDTLVHGWDMAKATRQQFAIDPALAEAALEFCGSFVTDEIRNRGAFGPIVPVADDASATDRLVGFLGRQP